MQQMQIQLHSVKFEARPYTPVYRISFKNQLGISIQTQFITMKINNHYDNQLKINSQNNRKNNQFPIHLLIQNQIKRKILLQMVEIQKNGRQKIIGRGKVKTIMNKQIIISIYDPILKNKIAFLVLSFHQPSKKYLKSKQFYSKIRNENKFQEKSIPQKKIFNNNNNNIFEVPEQQQPIAIEETKHIKVSTKNQIIDINSKSENMYENSSQENDENNHFQFVQPTVNQKYNRVIQNGKIHRKKYTLIKNQQEYERIQQTSKIEQKTNQGNIEYFSTIINQYLIMKNIKIFNQQQIKYKYENNNKKKSQMKLITRIMTILKMDSHQPLVQLKTSNTIYKKSDQFHIDHSIRISINENNLYVEIIMEDDSVYFGIIGTQIGAKMKIKLVPKIGTNISSFWLLFDMYESNDYRAIQPQISIKHNPKSIKNLSNKQPDSQYTQEKIQDKSLTSMQYKGDLESIQPWKYCEYHHNKNKLNFFIRDKFEKFRLKQHRFRSQNDKKQKESMSRYASNQSAIEHQKSPRMQHIACQRVSANKKAEQVAMMKQNLLGNNRRSVTQLSRNDSYPLINLQISRDAAKNRRKEQALSRIKYTPKDLKLPIRPNQCIQHDYKLSSNDKMKNKYPKQSLNSYNNSNFKKFAVKINKINYTAFQKEQQQTKDSQSIIGHIKRSNELLFVKIWIISSNEKHSQKQTQVQQQYKQNQYEWQIKNIQFQNIDINDYICLEINSQINKQDYNQLIGQCKCMLKRILPFKSINKKSWVSCYLKNIQKQIIGQVKIDYQANDQSINDRNYINYRKKIIQEIRRNHINNQNLKINSQKKNKINK